MFRLRARWAAPVALVVWCVTATGCGDPATKSATQLSAEQMKAGLANQSAEQTQAAPKK